MNDSFYGSGPPGPHEPGAFGEPGVDEQALRRMLQGAVDGLEPAPGTLDFLQRAVPARRARRRQLVVGVAAAVILIGTAVPTLVHVTDTTGDSGRSSNTADSRDADDGRYGGSGGPDEDLGGASQDTDEEPGKDTASESPGGEEASAGPSGSPAAAAPPCEPGQTGAPVSASGAPDASGRVTGSFTVTNISSGSCTVADTGGVQVGSTLGAASTSQIDTRTHTEGDAATGLLPAPTASPAEVVLAPSESYVVQFAWVPATAGSGGCGTDDGEPSPSPGATDDTGQSAPDALGESETTGGDGDGGEGEVEDGSVTLTHTPEGDAAATGSVTVENACAGTVYYTDAIPG